jgi:hypothetical protein
MICFQINQNFARFPKVEVFLQTFFQTDKVSPQSVFLRQVKFQSFDLKNRRRNFSKKDIRKQFSIFLVRRE